jgi:hypothetical protein
VPLLMRFRPNIAGEFVFHCHILSHEDKRRIRVTPDIGRQVRCAFPYITNIKTMLCIDGRTFLSRRYAMAWNSGLKDGKGSETVRVCA